MSPLGHATDGRLSEEQLRRVVEQQAAAISLPRTRRADLHAPDTLPERAGGPETSRTVENRVHLDALWELMQHLNEDARILVVLKEVDGLSYDEIASTLDLPLSTVKTRLYRARKSLKDALKDWN